MNRRVIRTALAALVSILVCGSTHAELFRAYLASDGLDSNPCTLAAPCRLLPAALAAVSDGGEIWMLDSANYNAATVNITKSVTILAIPGAVGSVVATAGSAIEASTPGTHVALRNLRVVPLPGGGGTWGILVAGAAELTVEDSVISGHPSDGINVFGQTRVRISHCTIRDNGSTGVTLAGGATAEISGTRILANIQAGVLVLGTLDTSSSATISDSDLSGNSNGLHVAANGPSSTARASVTGTVFSNNNGSGVHVFAVETAIARATLGGNTVVGNITGLSQGGGGEATLESLGNNIVRQNAASTVGTITTVPLM